jgi:hypothetical protein
MASFAIESSKGEAEGLGAWVQEFDCKGAARDGTFLPDDLIEAELADEARAVGQFCGAILKNSEVRNTHEKSL